MQEEDEAAFVPVQGCPDRQRWDRLEAAQVQRAYETAVGTERARADTAGGPHSTLRKKKPAAPDDEEARFFASPTGVRLLQRVTLAATVVFDVTGTDGLGKLVRFMELSRLGNHVAHSRGWLHKFSLATMEQMTAFESHVLARLKAGLKTKLVITLCLDETFHPRILLVAMEPVSGFIFVEKYADKRDAETWIAALKESMEGLEVEVVQVTSDQAKALLYVANEELQAQPSPDVMHVQHDMAKGMTLPLLSQERKAQKAFEVAVAATTAFQEALQAAQREPRSPGRSPDHERQVAEALERQAHAQATLEQATANRKDARQTVRDISKEYHPYDLETGEIRTDRALESKLAELLGKARDIVKRTELPQRCVDSVEKAGRVFAAMVNTLGFCHRVMAEHVATLSVSAALQTAMLVFLIPALYLRRAAKKAPLAKTRDAINKVAQDLLDKLYSTPAWLELDDATRSIVMKNAIWCADLFQRSSSCVEGRNGQLSLYHHALHRLSDAKLHALTIIHNYFIRRPDGTTAAERLYGNKHEEMFEWLLCRVPVPPRPAPHNARGAANSRRKLERSSAPPSTVQTAVLLAA